MKLNFQALVEWADEEGGPQALFYDRGVDLDQWDLTPRQKSLIRAMVDHYTLANTLWRNLVLAG